MKKSYISLSVLSVVAIMGSMNLSSVPTLAASSIAGVSMKQAADFRMRLARYPGEKKKLDLLVDVKRKAKGSIKRVGWSPNGIVVTINMGIGIGDFTDPAHLLYDSGVSSILFTFDGSNPSVQDFFRNQWKSHGHRVRYNGNKIQALLSEIIEFDELVAKSRGAGIELPLANVVAPIRIDGNILGSLSLDKALKVMEGENASDGNSQVRLILDSMSYEEREYLRRLWETEDLLRGAANIRYSLDVPNQRAELHASFDGGIELARFMEKYDPEIFSSLQREVDVYFGFYKSFTEDEKQQILGILEDYRLQAKLDDSGRFIGFNWGYVEMENLQKALRDYSRWGTIGGSSDAYIRDINLHAFLSADTIGRINRAGINLRDVVWAVAKEEKK